ncbi:hypothetical protein B0H13DRAFT_2333731 [Mycena leptocephala]|nr:hypothetical protein B0H13DRAFT_2333731 [Mycena leptocephala]
MDPTFQTHATNRSSLFTPYYELELDVLVSGNEDVRAEAVNTRQHSYALIPKGCSDYTTSLIKFSRAVTAYNIVAWQDDHGHSHEHRDSHHLPPARLKSRYETRTQRSPDWFLCDGSTLPLARWKVFPPPATGALMHNPCMTWRGDMRAGLEDEAEDRSGSRLGGSCGERCERGRSRDETLRRMAEDNTQYIPPSILCGGSISPFLATLCPPIDATNAWDTAKA